MDGEQGARAALESYRLPGVKETGVELRQEPHADVVEVKYMGLRCAGKKFHHSVASDNNEDLLRRCAKQCNLLLQLRHPNIVQFFGVYFELGWDVPVFVTELLPISLTECLHRYGLFPESMSYAILQDVALGLQYLHSQSPPIVHQDLSADNVWLTRDMSAKLADVSVAKIVDLDRSRSAYVPPEAFAINSRYDRKTDIFAYGVLMIHVVSGQLPVPDLTTMNSSVNSACLRSELDCRQEYLSEIEDGHPLKGTIIQCLSNSPAYRPTISEVLRKVGMLASQFPSMFANSLEMLQRIEGDADKERVLELQMRNLSPDGSVTEVEKLRQKVAKLSAQNIALRATLTAKLSTAARRGKLSADSLEDQQEEYSPVQLRQGTLKWTKCANIPVGMIQAQSVVIDGKVYVGGGGTDDSTTDFLVFEYNPVNDSWETLPPTPVSCFGIGRLSGELVIVGGKNGPKASNSVYVFDRYTHQWKESLPPLCTARYAASVVSHQSSLLACGGLSNDNIGGVNIVPTVEALNADGFHWYVGAYLPYSACLCLSSSIAIHDTFYIVGGYQSTTACSVTGATHCASFSTVVSSGVITPYMWEAMGDTPHLQATSACLGGCLLALGGTTKPFTLPVHQSIHAYSSATKSWIYIGDLPYACCHCTAVTLPSGEMLVLGGWVKPGEQKRAQCVFRGTLHCS